MENSEKILEFIQSQGISLYKLSKNLNISESTFSKWKNKPTSKVDLSIVKKIADFFKIGIDDLLDNYQVKSSSPELTEDEQELLTYFKELDDKSKGKVIGKAETLAELKNDFKTADLKSEGIIKTVTKTVSKQAENKEKIQPIYIEFYESSASAGSGTYLSNSDSQIIAVKENELTAQANFAVKINGQSMEPTFHDGDIALVRTQPSVEVGEIGIFIIDNEGFIKEFGGDKLISLNSKYKNIPLHEYNDIYCKGKVLGVLDEDDILD